MHLVTYICLVLASVLLAAVALLMFVDRWHRPTDARQIKQMPQVARRRSHVALGMLATGLTALTLAVISGGIDAKVADPSLPDAETQAQPSLAPAAQPTDAFASELSNFSGDAVLRDRVRVPLCLVRYYSRVDAHGDPQEPGANWWTTCHQNESFRTFASLRERLALLKSWGPRDARVTARIPAGTPVLHLIGRANRQCEKNGGGCLDGGGRQILFRDADFRRAWFVTTECAQGRGTGALRFKRCER